MNSIRKNTSLKPYNTFGIEVNAQLFFEYKKTTDIDFLIKQNLLGVDSNYLILGGGSNQLFTKNYNGLVIYPVNKNIELVNETPDYVWLKADAGIEWDEFVAYTVDNGWGGIENLSNIPGNVGASPVQNIGAYGVEAKDCIEEVHVVSLNNGELYSLTNSECQFEYRNSIFKNELKNKVLVDSVTFKLSKKPTFTVHYGSIKDELEKFEEVNLKNIRETIISIRESKLPDHNKIGNGGSFFKNPIVTADTAEKLATKYENMPLYDAGNENKKLAAGWLIEQCGLKGYVNKKGTAGIHDKQALVIINKGNATGQDIVDVAEMVQKIVFEKFGIKLEPEVIIHR